MSAPQEKASSAVFTKPKCGCLFRCNLEATGGGDVQWEVAYCSLHKAAPELFEALATASAMIDALLKVRP